MKKIVWKNDFLMKLTDIVDIISSTKEFRVTIW